MPVLAGVVGEERDHDGWIVRESGPARPRHTVLLLPGALATARFYDNLLAEPALKQASIGFVAGTLPGFGGTQPPDHLSMENYAAREGSVGHRRGPPAGAGGP